ncbi:MAG: peptide-methionine (S)-S-oxide reductase MsrA [Candidatus Cyclobacteriaceae bacterium M2_1C_046]
MKEEIATFAGGCFWCTEAVFNQLEGVKEVTSGYTGGKVKDPSYREVCGGRTGHAEAVQVKFDPDVISYDNLLDIFFATHDPTTLNRQGADVGTHYRSAIFYHNEEQHKLILQKIKDLTKTEVFDDPIVTEILEAKAFYTAEEAHQDYYEQNQEQPYCAMVINPKLSKLRKGFQNKLKSNLKA